MEAIGGFFTSVGGAISTIIIIVLIVLLCIVLFTKGYVKAPPDMAWVISGRKKEPRFVHGKSSIVIPFLERKDELNLSAIPVLLRTTEPVLTNDFIEVVISASVNVQIDSTNHEMMLNASKNWLGKEHSKTDYIASQVSPVLEGNLREIAGQIGIQDLVRDRQQVAEKVKESAEEAMQALGLTIRTFNISSIEETDPQSKILDSLGAENTAKILKSASVSKAENARIIREEQAKNETLANQAEVERDLTIAKRENELRIQLAELKAESDRKQADANIAGHLQEETRRQELEQATVDADIRRREREAELAEKEVAIQERKLEAEVNKKADSQRYAAEQAAEADLYSRTKKAEADKIEAEREAEAQLVKAQKDAEAELVKAQKEAEAKKAKAEADKFQKLQEAEGIEAVGRAQAAAIQAQGEAEAEATLKKAEAMKEYGQAAMTEMVVNRLPEIAQAIAAPLANIDNVSIIGGGNGDSGIGTYADSVPLTMSRIFQVMKETTGLDMVDIMSANSKSAQTEYNVHLDSNAAGAIEAAVNEAKSDK